MTQTTPNLNLCRHCGADMLFSPCCGRAQGIAKMKDDAYAERDQVVAAFACVAKALGWPVFLGIHEGDPWEDDWRNIIFIETPYGQASWHYHDSERPLFAMHALATGEQKWDGHSTPQKYERLREMVHDGIASVAEEAKKNSAAVRALLDRLEGAQAQVEWFNQNSRETARNATHWMSIVDRLEAAARRIEDHVRHSPRCLSQPPKNAMECDCGMRSALGALRMELDSPDMKKVSEAATSRLAKLEDAGIVLCVLAKQFAAHTKADHAGCDGTAALGEMLKGIEQFQAALATK